jgi:tetratricopeptide (TPR) repeat protein
MMVRCSGPGKVNVKLLIILLVVVVVACVSLVAARQTWRGILSQKALAAGQAAFEKQDWPVAVKNFRGYLGHDPNDLEVLRKYAESLMAIRPPDRSTVAGAIAAYRRILQLDPRDQTVTEKLATLYAAIENYEELAAIARARLEQGPNDMKAPLWLAEALNRLNKKAEARQTLESFLRRLEALPGKYPEYVRACAQMSSLAAGEIVTKQEAATKTQTDTSTQAAQDQAAPPQPTPLDWLNKAVAYAPESTEALAYRARFHRLAANAPDANDTAKRASLALVRRDLEAADALGTDDPRLRYSLGVEWMLLGELDRAAAELQAADKLPKDKLKEQFFDAGAWTVARFELGAQLALRRGQAAEAAALADETLASLSQDQEKGYRGRILPTAARVYVTAARAVDARRCLDEYLTLVQSQQVQAPSARALAGLKALVEAGENRPYGVIDLLESTMGKDPNNPQAVLLLTQAYNQTGQARRAVNALEQCRRLNPQDAQVARELARQYARTGDFEKAFDTARQAESLNPADVELVLLRLGAALSRALGPGQSPDTAGLKALSVELSSWRQQHPLRTDIRIFQALITDSLNQPQQAESELKQAIQECKEPLHAEVQLMRHYVNAGRVEDALRVCEASCARRKDLAEPWLLLSDLHMMKQDYDSARRGLQQGLEAVTSGPNRKLLSTKLALLELTRKDGDRAAGIRLLKELARDPEEIQARLLLLQITEVRSDPNEAGKLIGELRRAEGERGLWWRLYQASLWLSGPDAVAKQTEITNLLQYCISADPGWPAPVLLLAQMYGRQRDMKQAEETYRQGLLANPSATELAGRLLQLLAGQGRFAEAEKVLKQIQNPRMVADWRVLLAVGTGDFSRAIEELKLRVSNDKDKKDAASRIELARLTYQVTKDAAQALRYLEEAKTITPDSQTLMLVWASILKGEGKPAEALRVLDQYVADCKSFEAYWLRGSYLAEGDRPEQAEPDYRKLITFQENAAAGYELLASYYAGQERLDQAVATVEEGLRSHPDELRLKRDLMQHFLSRDQAGDKERALGILANLEKQLPQDPSLMMTRAVQKIGLGTPQATAEAREILEGIVKRDPTAVGAHLALVGIAMQEADYRTACDLTVRALASSPANLALLMARARAELALGYTSVAAKLTRQVLQQDPNRVDAFDVATQIASTGGERDFLVGARTLIDTAVRRHPQDERLLIARSRFYVALGQPKTALPELQAYCQTKEGASSVMARVTLADLYRAAGDLAQAEGSIKQLEESDPDRQIVVHAHFLWLATQKRWDDLKQISSAYIKAKDQDLATVLKAASILVAFDPPELKKEGLKLFEHAVSQWPTSVDARLGLASTLYQTGEAERAEKLYREVLEKHPNEVRALNDLAWILQEHDRQYDTALELANKGLRLAPNHLDLLDTRGTILSNLPNRLAGARSDFEELVRQSADDAPRQARALLQLGHVCVKLNDFPEAKRRLQTALEIDQKANVFTTEERSEIRRIMEQTGA